MVPATWLQQGILLTGEGCNGKSVYLSLLVRFLGRHNVATVALHRLEADKFAVSRLVGKLANICADDLPSEHLAGTSTFKALTGGDTLSAEHKFKDSFDLAPFARLVFSANHPPRSADSSAAFFRRWKVIPFDHIFAPDEQIPRDVLDGRLQAEPELSGLFNKALDGLRRVQQQRRFSEPESTRAAWRDFHATTDPLAVWLDRYTMDDPDCVVTKQALRIAYNAAVEREGRPAMTAKSFGQALYRLRPDIEERQRMIGGKYQWCYVGIGLASQDYALNARDARDARLYSSRRRAGGNGSMGRSNGHSSVGIISDDPVHPVHPDGCPHTNVTETPTHDGYVNRYCHDCESWLTCGRQEQPA
jgi:putative DNA primase/helicase